MEDIEQLALDLAHNFTPGADDWQIILEHIEQATDALGDFNTYPDHARMVLENLVAWFEKQGEA